MKSFNQGPDQTAEAGIMKFGEYVALTAQTTATKGFLEIRTAGAYSRYFKYFNQGPGQTAEAAIMKFGGYVALGAQTTAEKGFLQI